MNRIARIIVLAGGACCGMQAISAQSPGGPPVSPRHQLVACMTRQMSASRTISYIEATNLCKAQLKTKAPTLAAAAPDKPATGLGR